MQLRYAIIASLGLFLSSLAAAENLKEVLQQTLDTNPDVLISSNTRRAVEQELEQARGGYLPSVDLVGGYGREMSNNPSTRSAGNSGNVSLTRREVGLSISQMLFDGFGVKSTVDRQQSRTEAAAHRVYSTSESVGLRVVEVYLEILNRNELLDLAKDNLVRHQKMFSRIQQIVAGGTRTRADLQQSQSRLSLAESSVVSAQGSVRDADTSYQRVTGNMPQALVKPELSAISELLPKNLEAALALANQNHPSLRAANADLAAAEADKRQAKSNYMPRLSLELGASKNNNLDGVTGKNDDVNASLRLRYNLYRGGADQARVQETAERIVVAKENLRRTQRIVEEEVRLAWNSLTTMRERLRFLSNHVKASSEVAESYKEQFDKQGQRSLLDVLNAENEVFNARSAFTVGQYTELFATYKVLASMGILLNSMAVKVPDEASVKQ